MRRVNARGLTRVEDLLRVADDHDALRRDCARDRFGDTRDEWAPHEVEEWLMREST